MKFLGLAVALVGLLAAERAQAQMAFGGGRSVVATGGGFSWNNQGRNGGFSVGFRRASISSYGYYPYGYGVGPGFGPSLVVAPQPIIVVQPIVVAGNAAGVGNQQQVDPNRFKIIRPDRPNEPKQLPPPPPAQIEKKPRDVDLGVEAGEFPLARGPAANPRIEADRQIKDGRGAFDRGEYGRAIEHFRTAATVAPDTANVWFLLAESQFAAGRYDEAATSIVAGLKRQPDWPKSPFRSRELYRANPPAYDVHLEKLRNAATAFPEDSRLVFLLGVQLWFDSQREEARTLFEKAAKIAKDPEPAQAFLKVKD